MTLDDRLHDAVAQALQGEGAMMLTRCVVLAEVIDDAGDTAFYVSATPGTKVWQSAGMLRYALSIEDAATVVERIGGSE